MKALEEKILKEGTILPGEILKVDGFLNHRIDVKFLSEIGRETARLFGGEGINKILTIEASGIGIACVAAEQFENVPSVVFVKKSSAKNIGNDVYTSEVVSYTHGKTYPVSVSKKYLSSDDRILIMDDFLAKGSAMEAMLDLCAQAGATVVGLCAVIEKQYQGGGDAIRARGYRVESLAKVASMTDDGITFCD